MIPKALISTILIPIVSSVGYAASIGVDFGRSELLETDDLAGVVPQTNWNIANGFPGFTGVALVLQNGSASGATITFSDVVGSKNATSDVGVTADPNTEMFNRGVGIIADQFGGVAVMDMTLNNLPTTGDWASGFDLYLYFAPETGKDPGVVTLSAGGVDKFVDLAAGSNYSGSFIEVTSTNLASPSTSGNYAMFSGLSGSSLTFSVGGTGTAVDSVLTGIQLVAVPEPSAFGIIVASGIGIIVLRRRLRR